MAETIVNFYTIRTRNDEINYGGANSDFLHGA